MHSPARNTTANQSIVNRRQPPLLSVCHASRSVALKRLAPFPQSSPEPSPEDNNNTTNISSNDPDENSELGAVESRKGYYNNTIDILIIPSSRALPRIKMEVYKVERLGIYHRMSKKAPGDKSWILSGEHIMRELPSVKEITIIFGKCESNCEMRLAPVTYQFEWRSDGSKDFRKKAALFVSAVRNDVMNAGSACVVKTANLVPMKRTVSPYSY